MNWRKAFSIGLGGIIGAALAVSLGVVLYVYKPLGKKLVNSSYSSLFLIRPVVAPNEAVLVYMDDRSHDRLGQPYTAPWDRALHARVVDRLAAEGAKAIVFDVIFSDPFTNNPTADQQLADAIKRAGNVILGADYVTAGDSNIAGRRASLPFDLLLEGAANVGIAELMTDDDFVVRQYFPGEKTDLVSSLSWATAETIGLPVAASGDENLKFAERWLNYYGPPLTIPSVPYYHLVTDDVKIPEGFFKDKVVFIGSHIVTYLQGQRKDEYRNPYSILATEITQGKNANAAKQFMPGVEVHATAFLNLVRSDWLTRLDSRQEEMMIVLFGLFFGLVLSHMRPFHAAFAGVGGMIAIAAGSYYAFKWYRIWSPWLIVVAVQIPVAMVWSIVFNSVKLFVQKVLMEQSLSMYVSPSRVKQISKNPKILKPGAEKQELSILFSDIANFTNMSEGMDSDELAALMNNYFETTVSKCIDPAHGTVVKFIGDAIFAIWNAPELQPNHQELACQGALLLRDSVHSFTFNRPGVVVRTRIGLHAGVANVGNFGSRRRIDYTAIGENINLASRMEGLNKYLGTDILITGDIYRPVQDKFVTRYAGEFQLKGFERAVSVYELLSLPDQAEQTRGWREAFAAALRHFRECDLDAAEQGFRCALELHPNDGPSQFYLKQIAEFREHPPSPDWNGVIELKEK